MSGKAEHHAAPAHAEALSSRLLPCDEALLCVDVCDTLQVHGGGGRAVW